MITFIKKIISGQKKLYLGILAVLSLLSSFEFSGFCKWLYSAVSHGNCNHDCICIDLVCE